MNRISISIHAPPRGATCCRRAIRLQRRISIHAPPRGATTADIDPDNNSVFQFTPLREGRPERRKRNERVRNFNSRPSARGDTDSARVTGSALVFQFTPLREGRPDSRIAVKRIWRISIHAPPRGATKTYIGYAWYEGISIHAPPRGATRTARIRCNILRPFQFTPLREGRPLCDGVAVGGKHFNSRPSNCSKRSSSPRKPQWVENISIHAPPRGATRRLTQLWKPTVFQFTPLREGRRREDTPPADRSYFNSRPSARGDPCCWRLSTRWTNFNSRPSARGDMPAQRTDSFAIHFNSRPSARGDRSDG